MFEVAPSALRVGRRIGQARRPSSYFTSFVAFAALLLGCAHNVAQDKMTGPDGKMKGAKSIRMENGEGRASGIVTYPGGDRVDWKEIELGPNEMGTLEFKLTWTPPRPGLQLAMEIFDAYNYRLKSAKGKAGSSSRVKRVTLENAKGKYFVRIYALGRGDAGKYKLAVNYSEGAAAATFDPTKFQIPNPPSLPAVPPPTVPCDEESFDKKNPACRNICPAENPPPGWPACKNVCPNPPDINNPVCWETMECPDIRKPDSRIKKCLKHFGPCDPNNIDPENPNCKNFKKPPITVTLVKVSISGDGSEVVFGCAGKKIEVGMAGKVMRGQSDTPLVGGDFTVTAVGRECRAKLRLTPDQVNANPRFKIFP